MISKNYIYNVCFILNIILLAIITWFICSFYLVRSTKSYIDDAGRMIPGDRTTNPNKKGPDRPFEWDQVHAVVTFNSSITIKALTNGVPCFANFENPCLPICEQDFTKIETPKYVEREPLYHSMAYGQFTAEEMRNGYAWRILDES